MNAHELTTWPEEEALASRRREVCRTHGKIGLRSTKFTEGGYCTMFTEGIKLKGRPGIDGRIGTACQHVFDDEYGHMMAGVIGVDEEGLSDKEWAELEELTVEQLKLRLDMRNAQFSHPVSARAHQGDSRRQDRAGAIRLRARRILPGRARGGGGVAAAADKGASFDCAPALRARAPLRMRSLG